MNLPYCGICAQPITKDTDGAVAFFPLPENPDGRGWMYAHLGCARPAYERIALAELTHGGEWKDRLRAYPWWNATLDDRMRVAATKAHEMRVCGALFNPRMTELWQESVRPRRGSRTGNPARNISLRLRSWIMERDGFRCRRCGASPDVAELRVDHIVPVAKGGTADESNLQTLCHACNAGKSDSDPHDHDRRPFGEARPNA